MDLLEVGSINVERHWYYQAKLASLTKIIDSHISRIRNLTFLSDIGAGSGIFGLHVLREFQFKYLNLVDINFQDEIICHNNVTYSQIPVQKADIILLIDILEHVQNPKQFLKNLDSIIPVDGLLFITVPAFQSLWSQHDVLLKHFKRYTTRSLVKEIPENMELVEMGYLFPFIFPIAVVVRFFDKFLSFFLIRSSHLSGLHDHSNFVNLLLFKLATYKSPLLQKYFGLSVFAVLQKISA